MTDPTDDPRARMPGDGGSMRLPGDHPPRSAPPALDAGEENEIQWLLADARARAQQILDESMAKAEELMTERSATPAPLLAEIRGSVAELMDGMAEVRERLTRIEALLEERQPAKEAGTERSAQPRPERAPFSVVSPDAPPSTVPPAPTERSEQVSRAAAAGPTPARRSEPVQATEPRGETGPPPETVDEGAPSPHTPRVPPEPTEAPPPAGDEPFEPDRGAVVLRVSPVAGFQGLMRVQDALGHLDAIRQATVEAYAQGEARLRLELTAPIRAETIAEDLGRALEQPGRLRSHSIAQRSVEVALG